MNILITGAKGFVGKNLVAELKNRGYDIYLKPYRTYLFFYVVDDVQKIVTILRVMQDGMDWQSVLKRWLKEYE